jgi:hypothetical protein
LAAVSCDRRIYLCDRRHATRLGRSLALPKLALPSLLLGPKNQCSRCEKHLCAMLMLH